MKLDFLKKVILKITEPWEAYNAGDLIGEIFGEDSNPKFLLVLEQPTMLAGQKVKYLVGELRKNSNRISQAQRADEYECNLIATNSERAEGGDPLDLKWWRGGQAFTGRIKIS